MGRKGVRGWEAQATPFPPVRGAFPREAFRFRPGASERSWKREAADSESLRVGSGRRCAVRESLVGNNFMAEIPNQVEAENELTTPTTSAQTALRHECQGICKVNLTGSGADSRRNKVTPGIFGRRSSLNECGHNGNLSDP